METLKPLNLLFCVALFVGIAFVLSPQTAMGQKDKPAPDSKDSKQAPDDDDDDDDRVSLEEARSVKVPLESARAIALSKVPGKVIDEELEKERGRLQYAFDIKDPEGNVFDIEVDAETGEILQVVKEDDDDDDDDTAAVKRKEKRKVKTVEKTARVVVTRPN